jgi:hypothetical protein
VGVAIALKRQLGFEDFVVLLYAAVLDTAFIFVYRSMKKARTSAAHGG